MLRFPLLDDTEDGEGSFSLMPGLGPLHKARGEGRRSTRKLGGGLWLEHAHSQLHRARMGCRTGKEELPQE